jgi:hypothetical protein
LVFRGEQYARAIGLFQRKSGPGALPPSIDLLVDQRYLRKKYKDPITNDDFAPILLTAAAQPGPGTQGPQVPGGRGGATPAAPTSPLGTPAGVGGPGTRVSGGITGVTSKSKEQSIRLYKGRNHYNEWAFTFTPPAQAPGTGGGPAGRGGQRGPQGPAGPGGGPQGPFPPGGPGRGPGGPFPGGGRNPFPQPNPGAPVNPGSPGRGPVFSPPPPPGR